MTTTNLFAGLASSTAGDGSGRTVAADDDPGPEGRWSLHRAGIINVWQYDRVELTFAGGRMLLRGKNGAGKSKALEVLLPFLLDGDTRYLDATGRDRTTVAWLMTDGRPNGNHIGYLWLELRLCHPDGTRSFQTLGAGLRASTATRRADSWFFITDRRPGIDLDLEVANECLSLERIKEALGEDAVTTSGAEHRRRVGRHLFGLFDDARYRNLLHLLHRLRDPNIGNRVEAGELASVLTDALPPIDERVLSDAAGHFDDLDAIREQVDRSGRIAIALGQFLGAYRGYTRTVLAVRTAAVEAAEVVRNRAARTNRQLTRAVQEAGQAVEKAQVALGAAKAERDEREAERRELERSEGYRAHQDLVDRRERVAALDRAAIEAELAAAAADEASQRSTAEVTAAAGDLRRSLDEAGQVAAHVAGLAADAGLEPSLLGHLPTPSADGQLDPAEMTLAGDRARAARILVDVRRNRATEVRTLALAAERAEHQAAGDEDRSAKSEGDVDGARAKVEEARAAVVGAEDRWADAVSNWMATGPAARVETNWDSVRYRLTSRDGEPAWVVEVRQSVVDCLAAPIKSARREAAAAELALVGAQTELVAAEAGLAEIEAQSEARPEPAPHRQAERDPAAGAPFYELVDLGPQLSSGEAAGLESALAAAGLLDAWVQADGLVVHPDTSEVLLRTDVAPLGAGVRTLADVLIPARAEGGPVGSGTIEAVLRAIGLGEQPGAAAWVGTGGRWSLGVLRGAWSKDAVEFLGAGARRATRDRLLAEWRARVVDRREDVTRAGVRSATAAVYRNAVEELAATLPSWAHIEEAVGERRESERVLASVRARHEADRRQAEKSRSVANRLAAEVSSEALEAGLPMSVAALEAVLAVLAELGEALSEHRGTLRDLARTGERLIGCQVREADRRNEAATVGTRSHQRRSEHRIAAHELATLREALAATVDAVLASHSQVTARLGQLDESLLPAADQARTEALTTHATITARLSEASTAEQEAAAALVAVGQALREAVELPGVMLAAAGRDVGQVNDLVVIEPATDPAQAAVALAAAVGPLVDGDDPVSDGTILSRYDRLSESLAGGYDTAMDEHGGVKVVHVTDDTGRQPLAAVAARLAAEAEAAQNRLAAREREVFERFLLRELADEVRSKLLDAHDLVSGTNRTLAGVRTSHGKGAHLEWKLSDDTTPAGVAARLLVNDLRDEAADSELRNALLGLIEAERAADPSAGYDQHLRAALDYRGWHRFTVKVTDVAAPGSSRTLSSRLGLSQGEQRVLSYLALFSAASAHFEAIARETPAAPRLLLLDDAFAKVDEPTHGHLLGLLVDLSLDFVLTSERMWGCFASVPSLEIYEAVRDPAVAGVALVHFRWDGHQRHLVGL